MICHRVFFWNIDKGNIGQFSPEILYSSFNNFGAVWAKIMQPDVSWFTFWG